VQFHCSWEYASLPKLSNYRLIGPGLKSDPARVKVKIMVWVRVSMIMVRVVMVRNRFMVCSRLQLAGSRLWAESGRAGF